MSAPRYKTDKSDVGLYLTPEVFQLPYSFITRGILAEIHQLSQKTGICSASDAHFVQRFEVSRDTVSRAVQQLVGDGHLGRDYDTNGRLTRLLWPTEPTADHPQNQAGHYPQNQAGQAPDHPQNQASTRLNFRHGPPAKSGTKKEGEVRRKPTPKSAASRRVGGASFQSENGEESVGRKEPAAGAPAGSTTPPQSQVSAGASTTAGSTPAARAPGQGEHFAEFWEVWPTKQRRKDAAAAFAQLTADDQHLAAERAARWLQQHPRQVERGAVPYPAKWLAGEQWNDGPEPTDRSPRGTQPAAASSTARTNAATTIRKQQTGDWK